jgi:hypothetical protein
VRGGGLADDGLDEFFGEDAGFVGGDDLRMGIEDLLKQRGSRAGMSAKESDGRVDGAWMSR